MINSAVDFCITSISACLNWFEGMFNATGAAPFYLSFALIFITYKFLLQPMYGRMAASDRASRSSSKSSSKKE